MMSNDSFARAISDGVSMGGNFQHECLRNPRPPFGVAKIVSGKPTPSFHRTQMAYGMDDNPMKPDHEHGNVWRASIWHKALNQPQRMLQPEQSGLKARPDIVIADLPRHLSHGTGRVHGDCDSQVEPFQEVMALCRRSCGSFVPALPRGNSIRAEDGSNGAERLNPRSDTLAQDVASPQDGKGKEKRPHQESTNKKSGKPVFPWLVRSHNARQPVHCPPPNTVAGGIVSHPSRGVSVISDITHFRLFFGLSGGVAAIARTQEPSQ